MYRLPSPHIPMKPRMQSVRSQERSIESVPVVAIVCHCRTVGHCHRRCAAGDGAREAAVKRAVTSLNPTLVIHTVGMGLWYEKSELTSRRPLLKQKQLP